MWNPISARVSIVVAARRSLPPQAFKSSWTIKTSFRKASFIKLFSLSNTFQPLAKYAIY
jgi:hypothetical protein